MYRDGLCTLCFFQAEDGIRYLVRSRGLGDVYKRQDVARVLTRASQKWDGGYAIAGLIGNGDAFVARDPLSLIHI